MAPSFRNGNTQVAGQITASERIGIGADILGGTLSDNRTAVGAGPRPHIHHMIRSANGIFVMLHDNDRITKVTQVFEGADQAVIIALVQTDGWFIQHIHDPHQSGPNLGGQANALGFSAREGFCRTIQAQIGQPHVHQKFQTTADFLEDSFGDDGFLTLQLELLKMLQ